MCRSCQRAARRERAAEAARKALGNRAARVRLDRATMAKPPKPGPDWEEVAQRLAALPEEIQTTDEELQRARGEGPGPDDEPILCYPGWDGEGPERLARVRRYAADVAAGRKIRFVGRERTLSGPEGRTAAGAVDGSDGAGIGRQAGAGGKDSA